MVQTEPGCEQYGLYSDGSVLMTIERWASEPDLAAHMTAPALTKLLARAGHLLAAAPEIRTIAPLGFGDVVKGG